MSLHLIAVGSWPLDSGHLSLKDPEEVFTYPGSSFGFHLSLGFKVCILDTSPHPLTQYGL